MLPSIVTLIPTYMLFKQLGWLNTFLPLIVPFWFVSTPYSIFLIRQYYLTIPTELSEAARIDGASEFRIYWQIILPLSKPVFGALAVLSFVRHWNELLEPLIYLTRPDNGHCRHRVADVPLRSRHKLPVADGSVSPRTHADPGHLLPGPTLLHRGHRPDRHQGLKDTSECAMPIHTTLPGHWYKGNLHTHTTQSDGRLSPQEAVRWYEQNGYDFVALTDHDTFCDPAPLQAATRADSDPWLRVQSWRRPRGAHAVPRRAAGVSRFLPGRAERDTCARAVWLSSAIPTG